MKTREYFLLIVVLFLLPKLVTAQGCTLTDAACGGSELASSGSVTIPSATTYKISSGNTSSATITFTDNTSKLCIGGTWTGTLNGTPPAGVIDVYGSISAGTKTWSFSGGGITLNIHVGATVILKKIDNTGGNITITNCSNLNLIDSGTGLDNTGGSFIINNYASINITGSGNITGGVTFNNYTSSQLYVGDDLDITGGTFINAGNLCVTSQTSFTGGTLTNNGCYRTTSYNITGSGAFRNNNYMKIVGDFSSTGSNNSNYGTLVITGTFDATGDFIFGPGSLTTCVRFDLTGDLIAPGSSCAQIRATGVSSVTGSVISAANSSKLYFYDSGTPAGGFDSFTGTKNSVTITNGCTPTNFPACAMAGSACTTVLPIELLTFTGKMQEKDVLLSWVTATETNNNYFTLERSDDAQYFQPIGVVNGAGTSVNNINYAFLDNSPVQGINYYRLMQTDFDGKYVYSRIIAIDINAMQNLKLLYLFTDHNQQLQYQVSALENNAITVEVLDVLGKKVLSNRIGYDEDHDQQFNLDASILTKGVYFFKISDGKDMVVRKFVY